MINENIFKNIIKTKINSLLLENKEAMTKGDMFTYQNNCNELKGIEFVMKRYYAKK